MADKGLRLGHHYRWRVNDPIPPLDVLLKYVQQLPPEQGSHWVVREVKDRVWHAADTQQAMLRWRAVSINITRAIIAHRVYDGANPNGYRNTCNAPECVNPLHWAAPTRRNSPLAYMLERRPVGFVVTHGGEWPTKDLVVRVGKSGDNTVHILRVLVNDYGQVLQVLCGEALTEQHLITTQDATCNACIK